MVLLIASLVFLLISLLSYFVISIYADSAQAMELRFKIVGDLIRQQSATESEKLPKKNFSERILVPLGQRFSAYFKGITPAGLKEIVEKRLMLAGGMAGLSADQFIAVTGLLAVMAAGASILASFLLKYTVSKMIAAICYTLILGLVFPSFMLSRKIALRQASFQKDLPDVLDLVTVSVEAGLSFDGALAKLAEKMRGALVNEFGRVLQEMRMGLTRKDALKAMSVRCGNKDLSLFISSLVQADQLGVSVGSVLRVQAMGIRRNRQQQIEQKANKAPIQMLFPLVICIFPSLFIVVLGPAVLKIMDQLFK